MFEDNDKNIQLLLKLTGNERPHIDAPLSPSLQSCVILAKCLLAEEEQCTTNRVVVRYWHIVLSSDVLPEQKYQILKQPLSEIKLATVSCGTWADITPTKDFREQLSELTFEQLLKLKQKVGTKVYNEGLKVKVATHKANFGRINKNRPREVSSKIPFDPCRNVIPVPKKQIEVPRDPRFDSACGEFNEKVFNKSYSFVKKIRAKEKKRLYEELKTEKNEERKEEIKFLIQRIENKEREEKRKQSREEVEKSERLTRKQAVKDGKKPFFYKKSEKKLIDLVDNYETLKKSGKLKKHIERKIKKIRAKDLKNRKS